VLPEFVFIDSTSTAQFVINAPYFGQILCLCRSTLHIRNVTEPLLFNNSKSAGWEREKSLQQRRDFRSGNRTS
jgi:hypothetical protein